MTDAPTTSDDTVPELPSLDRSALDRLQRFGGATLLRQMIDLFLAAAPERIAAARVAVEAADAPSAELALHSLKSSAAQLGAMRMQRMCAEGEQLARAGTLDSVRSLVHELDDELALVHEWLAGIRDEEGA
jgi:HPt (histidine-containing phosphotransfer) domain-containing protein